MQRIKVVWLLTQNFPIDALRVRQPSLLMQRQTPIEFGLQCHRCRIPGLRLGVAACLRQMLFLLNLLSTPIIGGSHAVVGQD
jgi:hypothetical protein